jgi:hypothetical protein
MIRIIIMTSTLLASQVAGSPPPGDRERAAPKVEVADGPGAALARYNELKEKTPVTAAAQWKLGLWCEQHELKAEAYVHFSEVVRLDPRREAAWRKLGFKKYGRRWMTDEQIAEDNEQKKADKVWAPQLKKLHKDIHGSNGAKKRDLAQAALIAITDPRAIPSVYREFGGGERDPLIAIQILGQIDRPLSSKVLAVLAIYGSTSEIQRRATEILRGRPAGDFLDLLVGLMVDPLKYEVKPVGGPGSPGVLFVEGERFSVSRFYAPPTPNLAPDPGDILSLDQFGVPVITHPLGRFSTTQTTRAVPGSKTLVKQTETTTDSYAQYSVLPALIEAQKAAVMAEAQLEGDVALIKSINDDRKRFNDRVMAVAKDTTGKDQGRTPKAWRDALVAGNNSNKQPSGTPPKPTFTEMVPLAYQPAFVFSPLGFITLTQTRTQVFVDT